MGHNRCGIRFKKSAICLFLLFTHSFFLLFLNKRCLNKALSCIAFFLNKNHSKDKKCRFNALWQFDLWESLVYLLWEFSLELLSIIYSTLKRTCFFSAENQLNQHLQNKLYCDVHKWQIVKRNYYSIKANLKIQ